MSEENVELARALFDDLNSRDLESAFSRLAVDADFDNSRANGPNRGVLQGRDAIRAAWAEFDGMWENLELEPDVRGSGDQVAALIVLRVSGRDGIEVQARPAFVATIRDGEIAVLCFYQEHDEALEAAGLGKP